MKKLICIVAVMVAAFVPAIATADEYANVVIVDVKEENTEPAEPIPYDLPTEHELSYSDVETLARLAWSSPLRSTTQKRALMWSAINRIGIHVYGNTLAEVVNITEYPFYDNDAHVSAENEQLARAVLNEWLSECDGLWIDRLVPRAGVMIRFVADNRKVQILDKNGVCVWEEN